MALRVKNVAAGFVDATGFHPIRRSPDYDADRAGDDYGSAKDSTGLKYRRKRVAPKHRKPTTRRKATAKRKSTTRSRRANPRDNRGLDSSMARELELFITNDGDLYRQQYKPILANLATKKARGVYDHSKAVKLFGYLVESGLKKYTREVAGGGAVWHEMAGQATRKAVAEALTRDFETEYGLGNYEHLKPKKYQGKKNPIPTSWVTAKVKRLGHDIQVMLFPKAKARKTTRRRRRK